MKVPIHTSVVSMFIEVQNLFCSENNWTSLTFTRPRVVLTRILNFKMSVNLSQSMLYCENLYSYTFLD